MPWHVSHYIAPEGEQNPYLDWLKSIRDTTAKVAIIRRMARIELGNLGDHKFCRDGVWELRLDIGAGYRVYYALMTADHVLLLLGGTKPTQRVDIQQAVNHWREWQRRPE